MNPAFGFRGKVQQEAIEIIKDFLIRSGQPMGILKPERSPGGIFKLSCCEDRGIIAIFALCIKSLPRGAPTEQPEATVAKRCGLFNIKKSLYHGKQQCEKL